MRIAIVLSATLISTQAFGAPPAQAPHWRNGDLICPDGSAGKPPIMPHARPTAHDLDIACSMRAENQRLRDAANRPVRSVNMQERQRERDNVTNFLGKPN